MTVTIKKGLAEVRIDNNRILCCLCINSKWDLFIRGNGVDPESYICENKTRLSTINKYAAKYGVQFVQV